ncbi:probable isoprenylcysteine alpha-carbonyl methylesterase ICMEL2 isoform X2 [Ricinus communis]|uniref:protein-S-isoprenylcysteine alpha-carbonyl methylesterase n=1 Tax=Ricinus communis TaxID=3988 RepID=B9T5X2_RICCO|nr:probable isoprenylcysteine alpha-carbonyl methylesterase ICMEL2 isoform X2 [Ricinus communis]EEF28744.1 carboxylesterase, putative [Ricinus communis]|eukprot:XP_002533641.1 probable isoprenylcysteine alpha-carbonyl methylesterase ICMEL2 isoform X2 [Ricinus communis]
MNPSSLPAAPISPDLHRSFPPSSSSPSSNGENISNSKMNNGGGNTKQQPRRRVSAAGRPAKPERQQSFSRDIGHAACETYLLTRLTFTLLRYLGVGYRWITRLAALAFYAFLLMPGFLQVAYYYFFSSQVRRSIIYGDQPRNRLDLYLPENMDGPKPVVAFVTGGAWIIGYKAWGSLLGKQLAERDIIVACIDYRNFPQGTISDMVIDASQGISFIFNNISEYGGDPNRIYLMGQSAGAHISACVLVDQAIREARGGKSISWSVSQIKAYFGLSGGYNLFKLVDHFNNRGLYRSLFLSIMEGEESLHLFSPEVRIESPSFRHAVSLLPPITLFHGNADYSIPSASSQTFVDALQRLGAKAELILYKGKTHTDLFLQDPLRGGKDDLFDHIVAKIHAGDKDALAKDAIAPPRRRLVPELLLRLAGHISPF